jgi:hypothetical protein
LSPTQVLDKALEFIASKTQKAWFNKGKND